MANMFEFSIPSKFGTWRYYDSVEAHTKFQGLMNIQIISSPIFVCELLR